MSFLVLIFLSIFAISVADPIVLHQQPSRNASRQFHVMDFEWSNCDDSHSTITKLEVGPDPVNLPGSVSVGLDGVLAKDIVSGSPFKIRIKKKIAFFWINVPCKDGSGSCDYEDFCTKWPIPTPCPDAYVKAKIPCTCPIKAGHYVMPFSNLGYLNEPGLPHWLENGEYKLQALVTSKDDGKSLLCFNLHLHIKAL